MKRIGLTVIVALLLCYVTSPAQVAESEGLFLGGFSADAGTFSGIVGVGVNVGPLWTFTYKNVDKYGEINFDIVKFFKIKSNIQLGAVAGPGVDWEPKEGADSDGEISTDDVHSYVFGSAGVVLVWEFSPTAGMWGYGKARTRMDPENKPTSDGYQAGIGFYFRIGK